MIAYNPKEWFRLIFYFHKSDTFIKLLPLILAAPKIWPVSVFFISPYVLSSMELIAEEIENPFGYDANDLPTDSILESIENNTKEIKGF